MRIDVLNTTELEVFDTTVEKAITEKRAVATLVTYKVFEISWQNYHFLFTKWPLNKLQSKRWPQMDEGLIEGLW